MRDFKIKVTPQESEMVQKLLFLNGTLWIDGVDFVCCVNERFLYLLNRSLMHGDDLTYFMKNESRQLTFEQFLNEIEIELYEKNQTHNP